MILDRLRLGKSGAWVGLCCVASGLVVPDSTFAQTSTAAAATPAPAAEMTPAERAQRDADNVYRWILIHADKPRKPVVAAPREDKPSVVTLRAKPAARAEPASAGTVAASTPSQTPAAEPPAVPTPSNASPAAAAPDAARAEPVVTAAARPEAESLSVPVNLPGPTQTSTPSPAAVAAEALDEALTPISRAAPQFPASVLRSVRKGQVQVRFTVQPDGSVTAPEVLTSSNPRLNQAALAAIAQWRFVPLQRAQSAQVELGFDLD